MPGHAQFLRSRLVAMGEAPALADADALISYAALEREVGSALAVLRSQRIAAGAVVALEADWGLAGIAALLALVDRGCIVVPLTAAIADARHRELAQVEYVWRPDTGLPARPTGVVADHPLLAALRERGHPGLVLFTSGTSGTPKVVLHDFAALLQPFQRPLTPYRTLLFLLFDHIGGVNTLLHALHCGAQLVLTKGRSPDAVATAIERHRVQLLPVSPSFLNLLLLSEAPCRFDLSCLEIIQYSTEVMPATTLARIQRELPGVRTLQAYGMSEMGPLRAKSRSGDSLFVAVGGDGVATRVVNGELEIRAPTAMLGYLNAPSPFTSDGWLRTGDAVERDGDYLRILGRRSDMINVGGQKVHPAEVEAVLMTMPGVVDAVVAGETNPIIGQIVTARVQLAAPEAPAAFRKRMWATCTAALAPFQIPQKVILTQESLVGRRLKKQRARSRATD